MTSPVVLVIEDRYLLADDVAGALRAERLLAGPVP